MKSKHEHIAKIKEFPLQLYHQTLNLSLDGNFKSIGKLTLRISTPDGSYIQVDMDVALADIHLILGIDLMDR